MNTIERDAQLTAGKVVGGFWFNEKTAHSFVMLVTFAQINDVPVVHWPNRNREWVQIPTINAVEMCKTIISELQLIYRSTA